MASAFAMLPSLWAENAVRTLNSPDKAVEVQVQLNPLTYSVSMQGHTVLLSSALGLELKDQPAMEGWKLLREERHSVDRTWTPVWGKDSNIRDQSTETHLLLL